MRPPARPTWRPVALAWLLSPACGGAQPASAPPPAEFAEVLPSAAVVQELRHGGLVLYMRHGPTDNRHPDRASGVDLNDCSTQRVLSGEGRRVAAQVGQAIRKMHWPLVEVIVSPLCRTRDTAELAFGSRYNVDLALGYSANMTTAQKPPTLAATRRWLSEPVAAGGNRMVVAHGPNLMDVIGYFPKEGTVAVFRPQDAGRFAYLGSVRVEQWGNLSR